MGIKINEQANMLKTGKGSRTVINKINLNKENHLQFLFSLQRKSAHIYKRDNSSQFRYFLRKES